MSFFAGLTEQPLGGVTKKAERVHRAMRIIVRIKNGVTPFLLAQIEISEKKSAFRHTNALTIRKRTQKNGKEVKYAKIYGP